MNWARTRARTRWPEYRLAVDHLLSRQTRRRLLLALAGSISVAFAEVVGVAALLPLMQLMTGSPIDTGFLGWISRLLDNPSEQILAIVVSVVAFGIFVLKGLMTIAFRWWLLGFINEQEAQTALTLLQRYLTAPYWLHLQRNTASLIRTMNDAVAQTYSNFIVGIIGVATELAGLAGIVVFLFLVSPLTTIVAVAYFGITGYLLQRWTKQRAAQAGDQLMDSSYDAYKAAFHALGGVKEIKIRRKADHFLNAYEEARLEFGAAKRQIGFMGELPRYVLEIVFIVGIAVMCIAAFTLNDSDQGIAVLALFAAAGFRLLPSMARATASANGVRTGRRGIRMVLADLSDITADWRDPQKENTVDVAGDIKVAGLSFNYRGSDQLVLDRVNFAVPAGSSFAVVGGSGAGKSTLVDLILGLHQPSSGSVSVDGVNIEDKLPSWQRSIGLVPQDVYLLDDTLRSNIAFGEAPNEIDPTRLAEAVELAQLDQVLADSPDGLETIVGERGVRLSGGQRQRIGIARALYLRPRLLVLDEATSALDNETERRITETVDRLHGRMTIIVVAHRLSTVRHCDRLLFLADGRVEAIGTFDEVRDMSADFDRLVELGDLSVPRAGSGPKVDR